MFRLTRQTHFLFPHPLSGVNCKRSTVAVNAQGAIYQCFSCRKDWLRRDSPRLPLTPHVKVPNLNACGARARPEIRAHEVASTLVDQELDLMFIHSLFNPSGFIQYGPGRPDEPAPTRKSRILKIYSTIGSQSTFDSIIGYTIKTAI